MITTLPHLRSIVDHDGAVILDFKRDQFFSLNPVGAYIWTRLLDGEGVDQIAKSLAEDTETEIAVVLADVSDFMEELKSKSLIHFQHNELINGEGGRHDKEHVR